MLKPYKIRNLAFKKGTLSTVTTQPAGNGHDYLTVLKYALQLIHTPYVDDCCLDEENNAAPVRFNVDTAAVQYYDAVTKTWVDAP